MISANELKKILQIQEHYNDVEYLERAIDKELVSNPVNIKDGVSITISGEFNDKTIDLVIKKYIQLDLQVKEKLQEKHFLSSIFFNKKEDNL